MNELPLAKKSKLKREEIPIVSPLSPTAVAALAASSTSPRAQSALSARKPGVGAHLEPLFHHTALPPTAPITAGAAATARLTRRVSSGDKDSLMSIPSPSETVTSWMNTNAPNIITEWLNHHTDTIIRAAVNQLLTTTSTSTQPNLQQQILTQLQSLVASQAQNKAFHKVSKPHGNTRKPSIDNLSSSGVSSAGDDDDVEVKGSDDDDQDDDVDDDDADMSTSETSSNIHMGFKSRTSIHSNTSQEDGVDFPNVEDPRDAIKKKMMKKFDTHDTESQPIRTPAFPQKKSPQPQATRRPVGMAGAKSSVGSGGFDLLLVEDVRVSQRIAHHALTRAHYKVDVASDGETAVEKFKQHMSSLRIVLMDINLPGISGIEATEQIRKHERDHRVTNPVLVFGLTGNVDEDSLRSYEQVGMNGCILKGKLLVESVREAVDAASRSSEFVNLCGEGNKRRAGYTSGSENDSGDDRGSPQQPKRAIPLTQQIAMKQTQQKIKPDYDTKTETTPMEDTTPTPAPKRTTPSSTSTTAIPVHVPGSTSGPDVLLVEDVRVSQRIAHQALTRAHYKVEVASDGETAVEKFRTYQTTLRIILMDINLPGISGIEATEQIRKMERAAGVTNPVLVFGLTGNVDQDNLRTYEEVGMNGCILKGKLLVDAVQQATLEYSKTPGTFVDLASKQHEAPKTEAPKPKKQLGLGLRSAGAAQASLIQQATPPTSTSTAPKTTKPEEDADDDEEMVVERDEAAKLEAQSKREAELSGRIAATRAQALKREGQGVAIGTPRASQPRQLLASKFAGAGKVKPGVGLPSATTTTTTSSTSSERPLGLQRTSTKSSNGPDCLLVEDVRVSQRIAQQALTRAHYKVDVASDGETSVEKFKQHMDTLRIVLMDINLPGISGIEATERIRKHERDQKVTNPVLVFGLTGNVDEDSLRSYEQVGMNGCILKGKLLVDSVKKATEEAARNPTKFVNLVGDSDPSASP